MLKLIEKILVKLAGNTAGRDYNMWDWDVMTLASKWRTAKPLTKAETAAKGFLEEIGAVLNIWDPPEKWHKAYGKDLNEKRELH